MSDLQVGYTGTHGEDFVRAADGRDIPEVLSWLQEQRVGDVRVSFWSVAAYVISPVKAGRYLVIPLDTEPPKEKL